MILLGKAVSLAVSAQSRGPGRQRTSTNVERGAKLESVHFDLPLLHNTVMASKNVWH